MSMTTTNLDSTYFTNNPNPPWILNTPNTQYVLTTDVHATGNYGGGELFKLSPNQNIEFNLAGHYIYYNGWRVLNPTDSDLTRSAETTRAKPGFPNGNPANDSVVATQAGASVLNSKIIQ